MLWVVAEACRVEVYSLRFHITNDHVRNEIPCQSHPWMATPLSLSMVSPTIVVALHFPSRFHVPVSSKDQRLCTKWIGWKGGRDFQGNTIGRVKPNSTTKMGALEQGMHMHQRKMEGGLLSDIIVGNALVDMSAKYGSINKACKLFDKMP